MSIIRSIRYWRTAVWKNVQIAKSKKEIIANAPKPSEHHRSTETDISFRFHSKDSRWKKRIIVRNRLVVRRRHCRWYIFPGPKERELCSCTSASLLFAFSRFIVALPCAPGAARKDHNSISGIWFVGAVAPAAFKRRSFVYSLPYFAPGYVAERNRADAKAAKGWRCLCQVAFYFLLRL